MTDFEKARDEELEKAWLSEEPFGFDHPDTFEFIKKRMDWAYEWCEKEHVKEVSEHANAALIIGLEQGKDNYKALTKEADALAEALRDIEDSTMCVGTLSFTKAALARWNKFKGSGY